MKDKKSISQKSGLAAFIKEARKNRLWRYATSMLAVLVVFVTAYVLILPGITLTVDGTDVTGDELTYTSGSYESAVYNGSEYTAYLHIEFSVDPDAIQENDYTAYGALPEGVTPPDSYTEGSILYNTDGTVEFEYCYVQDDTTGLWYIVIYFDEDEVDEYVDTESDDITGYFEFYATISEDLLNSEDNVVLDFSDSVKVTITGESIKTEAYQTAYSDIYVSKSASNYDATTNSITYTVYVYSTKGTLDNIELNDLLSSLPTGLTVETISVNSVTSYSITDSYGTTSDSGTLDKVDSSSSVTSSSSTYYYSLTSDSGSVTGLDMVLPALSSSTYGTGYRISYTVSFNDISGNVAGYVDNTATASAKDSNASSGEVTYSATCSKYVNYAFMSKTGTVNSDGTITWTITINPDNNTDLVGYVLSDSMLATIEHNDLSVTESGYYANTGWQFSQSAGTITFSNVYDEHNYNTYVITYTTSSTATLGSSSSKVENTASLEDGSGSAVATATGSAYASGGSVSKSSTGASTIADDGTLTIDWASSITIPQGGIASNTIIYDYLPNSWSYTSSSVNEWFTWEQVEDFLFTKNYYNYITLSDGSTIQSSSYTISFCDYTAGGGWVSGSDLSSAHYDSNVTTYDDHIFTAFKIEFTNAVSVSSMVTMTLSYTTTADASAIVNGTSSDITYDNQLVVGSLSKTGSYTATATVAKMDGNEKAYDTDTTTYDGTVTWKVRVYIPEDNNTSYTVVDTLPSGVTLKSVYLNQYSNYNAMTYDADTGTLTGTLNNTTVEGTVVTTTSGEDSYQTVTIELPSAACANNAGGYVWICYVCTLNEEIAEGETSVEVDGLKNSVIVYSGSGTSTEYGSASQTQDVTYTTKTTTTSVVDKYKGDWDNDNHRFTYEVLINLDAADLLEGSDTLTLTDVLSAGYDESLSWGYYATLIQNSVVFYELVPLTATSETDVYTDADGNSYTYNSDDYYTDADGSVYYKKTLDIAWTYTQTASGSSAQGTTYHTITASVPDSTSILMEYTYYVYLYDPVGQYTQINNLSNSVSLTGVTKGSDQYTVVESYSNSGFAAGANTNNTVTIQKVDAENNSVSLKGAEFELYKWVSDSSFSDGGYWKSTGLTFTTNSSGKFSFDNDDDSEDDWFAYNTAYYLVETEAPDGYELDDESKFYFYWSSSDTETYAETYPSGFTSDSTTWANVANLSSGSHTFWAYNQAKNYVEVEKVWVDQKGNTITEGLPDSVTVDLYYYTSSSEDIDTDDIESKTASDGRLLVEDIVLSADNDWTARITEYTDNGTTYVLPAYDSTNDLYYHYYFVETEVGGVSINSIDSSYKLSYSTSDGNGDCNVVNAGTTDGGMVTITNTITRTYTDISVTKAWSYESGTRTVPESAKSEVTLALLRVSSADTSTVETVDTVTLDGTIDKVETTAWAVAWNDLLYSYSTPSGASVTYTYYIVELNDDSDISVAYSGTDTSSLTYTVTTGEGDEVTYTAYAITISSASDGGTVTVTNTIPTPDTKSLTATKAWKNYDGTTMDAPTDASVTLQLYVTNGITSVEAGGTFSEDGTTYTAGSSVANYGGYTVTLNYASGSVTVTTTNGSGAMVTLSSGESCTFTDSEGDAITVSFDGTNVIWSGMYGAYDYYVVETAATADGESLDSSDTDSYTTYYSVDGGTTVSTDASDYAGAADTSDNSSDTVLTVINRANSGTTSATVNKVFTGGTTEATAIYFQLWQVADVVITDSSGNETTSSSKTQITDTSFGTSVTDGNSVFYYVLSGDNSWTMSFDGLADGSRVVSGDGTVTETTYTYYVVETGASTSSSLDTYSSLDSYKVSYSTSATFTQDVDSDGDDETAYKIGSSGSITITNADAYAILALEKEWAYEDGEEADNTSDATAKFTLWREASYTVYNGTYHNVDVYNGWTGTCLATKMVPDSTGVTVTVSSSLSGGYQIDVNGNWYAGYYSSMSGPVTIEIDASAVTSDIKVTLYGTDGDFTISYEDEEDDTGVSNETSIEEIGTVPLDSSNGWSYNWQLATEGEITVGDTTYDCTYTYYLTENSATYLSQSLDDMTTVLVDSNSNTLTAADVTDSNGKEVKDAYAVTLGSLLTTVTATNTVKEEAQTTSVSATKKWDTDIATGSVTFTLVQLLVNPDSSSDDDKWIKDSNGDVVEDVTDSLEYTKTFSVTESSDGAATWDDLPTSVKYEGTTYDCAYFVAETMVNNAADGTGTDITNNYESSYSSSTTYTGSDGVVYYLVTSDNPVTVTNTAKNTAVLPSTGGSGSNGKLVLLGSSIALLALMLILARRRKREVVG